MQRFRLRKRNGVYQARGTVPVRAPNGKVAWRRVERSTRSRDKTVAQAIAAQWEKEYIESAYLKTTSTPTFAAAALTYMETTGKTGFMAPLIDHFGPDITLEEIDQDEIMEAARTLYPGRKAATINRQVFTPVIAVMTLARYQHNLTRPTGHNRSDPVAIPDDAWFQRVLPQCNDDLAALIVFLTLHGRRLGEALALSGRDIDLERREVLIVQTKADKPILVPLAREFIAQLVRLEGWQDRAPLFGYHWRKTVCYDLKLACKRAGAPYYTTKALGRHAFASRLLREGYSLKHVQEAGGWASIRVPAKHYAHLERSHIRDSIELVAKKWAAPRRAS